MRIAKVGLAFAAVFFTSDAVGWVINSISLCFLTIFRREKPGNWYSSEWKTQLGNTPIWDVLRSAAKPNEHILGRFNEYREDTMLSYFWQRAPETIVKWVSRRHTVYWASWTTIFACALSILLFFIGLSFSRSISLSGWDWGRVGLIVLVAGAVCVLFWLHASTARREANQMIELWFLHKFGDAFGENKGIPEKLKRLLDLVGDERRWEQKDGKNA